MPPKPDLDFHTALIAVETTHSAFTVQLSPAKPAQDISHATRPMAPIIEDWVSDSDDESEPNDPQSVPSFVQTTEHVKPSRHSDQPVETPILTATPKPTSSKTNVLLKSKPVSVTAARPVSDVVPKIMVTKPRYAHSLNTKSNLIIRRNKTHSQSSKTSNSSPKVTVAKAQVFCGLKGIKREFSVPRTPQQNGIAERMNRTLIEAVRTMLADLLLPIPFWAEAVNTARYVQNRVLVTKPQNKTPYELLHGRTPSIGFMRPFGCPVNILNTLDPLGKFERNVDEGFLVGYSVNSKAFRVFNSRTRIVQETLHINFLENKPNIVGIGPTWLFDIDSLTRTMNYQPVTAGNKSNPGTCSQEEVNAEKAREEATQQYMLFPVWSTGSSNPQNKEGDAAFDGKEHDTEKLEFAVNLSPSSSAQLGRQDDMSKKKDKGNSLVEYFTGNRDLYADFENYFEDSSNNVSDAGLIVPTAGQNYSNSTKPISVAGPLNTNTSPTRGKSSLRDASQPLDILEMENIAYSDHENVGAEADFNNLETSITFSPIPTTRTHKDHPIAQIIGDLSSTTQTRSMTRVIKNQGGLSQIFNDDFHTCMFACLLSQEEPKRVHQALKDLSWIEAIQEELLQFKMQKV
nr:hypothetical protein [Tanacetum cinerariifolium]